MFARWINDPEVRRGLAYRGLANEDAELKWFEEMTEAGRVPRPTAVAFAVHDAADAVVARYLNGIAEDAERFGQPERLQRRTRGFIRLGKLVPRRVLAVACSA